MSYVGVVGKDNQATDNQDDSDNMTNEEFVIWPAAPDDATQTSKEGQPADKWIKGPYVKVEFAQDECDSSAGEVEGTEADQENETQKIRPNEVYYVTDESVLSQPQEKNRNYRRGSEKTCDSWRSGCSNDISPTPSRERDQSPGYHESMRCQASHEDFSPTRSRKRDRSPLGDEFSNERSVSHRHDCCGDYRDHCSAHRTFGCYHRQEYYPSCSDRDYCSFHCHSRHPCSCRHYSPSPCRKRQNTASYGRDPRSRSSEQEQSWRQRSHRQCSSLTPANERDHISVQNRSRGSHRSDFSRPNSSHGDNHNYGSSESQVTPTSILSVAGASTSRNRAVVNNELPKLMAGLAEPGSDMFPLPQKDFQEQVFLILSDIRQQLSQLRPQTMMPPVSDDGEVYLEPCTTMEELYVLDNLLNNLEYRDQIIAKLSRVGGSTVRENVQRVMERLMKNEVMANMNLKGKGKKHAFVELRVYRVVLESVMKSQQATEDEIYKACANVLKYAPDRRGGGGRYKTGENNE